MNRNTRNLQRRRIAIGIVLSAGLAGCGGGGGGSPEPPQQTNLVTVSASNQDTVAHAAATALGTIGVTSAMPLSGAPGLSQDTAASRAAVGIIPWAARLSTHVTGMLDRGLTRAAPAVAPGTARPLRVYGPDVQYCLLSGSMSLSLDDRNDNGMVDVGDMVAMDFNACADDASGTVNGHAEATITALAEMSMSMRMAMTALSTTSASHKLTVGGAMALDLTADAAGDTATMRLTADGPLTVTAQTHGFDDTVTMQSGFVQHASFDTGGTSHVTVSGRIESTAMGGAVDLSTLDALVTSSAGAYPSSGAIRLTGMLGKLTLTAAGDSARMDLDDDNDNETEATKMSTWDWLF